MNANLYIYQLIMLNVICCRLGFLWIEFCVYGFRIPLGGILKKGVRVSWPYNELSFAWCFAEILLQWQNYIGSRFEVIIPYRVPNRCSSDPVLRFCFSKTSWAIPTPYWQSYCGSLPPVCSICEFFLFIWLVFQFPFQLCYQVKIAKIICNHITLRGKIERRRRNLY